MSYSKILGKDFKDVHPSNILLFLAPLLIDHFERSGKLFNLLQLLNISEKSETFRYIPQRDIWQTFQFIAIFKHFFHIFYIICFIFPK